jgi:coenzyme Q-binding protein COQ10
MPSFGTKRQTPYSANAMLELVADVERYPQFVPLCEELRVLSRSKLEDGAETIVARMTVGYGPIRESFTSRVLVDRAARRIDVTYLDGPFRYMSNRWSFVPRGTGSEIDFHIAYEFRSFALQMLLGSLFDKAFRKFAQAFEARARLIYGAVPVPT